jgi:hypothetical protein
MATLWCSYAAPGLALNVPAVILFPQQHYEVGTIALFYR